MEKCMDAAVKYLSYQSRTESEVILHLQKKGFSEDLISKVIVKLKEYRYIDDEEYLKSFLATNQSVKKHGRKRVLHDLQKKGLSQQLLNKLDECYPLNKEQKLCQALAQKYEPTIKGKSLRERQKKLYEKLIRLGYGSQMAIEAVNGLDWDESSDDLEQRNDKLQNDYHKLVERLKKKGYEGYELKQRTLSTLAMRGYDYESIQSLFESDG
ncbi:RecX family transcriptional regulator [Eubacteriaceae bacterium ES2]|nr:RecX family transcriptional regulator [Eubacteriaceae bacterium ES2]